MTYTIAIRIPSHLMKQLKQSAKVAKQSRSEIIRAALEDYFSRVGKTAKDPYEVLSSLMPFEEGGAHDLALRSEEYLRKKFHARSGSH